MVSCTSLVAISERSNPQSSAFMTRHLSLDDIGQLIKHYFHNNLWLLWVSTLSKDPSSSRSEEEGQKEIKNSML